MVSAWFTRHYQNEIVLILINNCQDAQIDGRFIMEKKSIELIYICDSFCF